jgi:hypothetical protein
MYVPIINYIKFSREPVGTAMYIPSWKKRKSYSGMPWEETVTTREKGVKAP